MVLGNLLLSVCGVSLSTFYVGSLLIYMQSVATFFSHVMYAIGGNTAGPGWFED